MNTRLPNEIVLAAKSGDLVAIKVYLDVGNDVNNKDNHGKTLLHYAAKKNQNQLIQVLLDNGAKTEIGDSEKLTPLHWATKKNNPNGMKLLLKHGANVDAVDEDDWTPLLFAINLREKELVEILLKNNANVNHRDNSDAPAIATAIAADQLYFSREELSLAAFSKDLQKLMRAMGPEVLTKKTNITEILLNHPQINLNATMGTERKSILEYAKDLGAPNKTITWIIDAIEKRKKAEQIITPEDLTKILSTIRILEERFKELKAENVELKTQLSAQTSLIEELMGAQDNLSLENKKLKEELSRKDGASASASRPGLFK